MEARKQNEIGQLQPVTKETLARAGDRSVKCSRALSYVLEQVF